MLLKRSGEALTHPAIAKRPPNILGDHCQTCCDLETISVIYRFMACAGHLLDREGHLRSAWRLAGRAELIGLAILMDDIAPCRKAIVEAALNRYDFILVDDGAAASFRPVSTSARPLSS